MTNTAKCQVITRNGKPYHFFPDVTVDDLTKGFLIDSSSPVLAEIQMFWDTYCATKDVSYFGVYISLKLNDTRERELLYTMYQSLPASLVEVIGMAVPKQSVIVKKRRVASL